MRTEWSKMGGVSLLDDNGVKRLCLSPTAGSVSLALYPKDEFEHGSDKDTEPILRVYRTGERERQNVPPVQPPSRHISWSRFNLDQEDVPDLFQLCLAVLAGEADVGPVLDWLVEYGPGVIPAPFLDRLGAAVGVS